MISAEPKSIAVADLPALVAKLDVYLYLTKRWMEWAPPGAGDAKVMQVDPSNAGNELTVSFSGGLFDTEKIPFDARMKFVLKKKGEKK